MAGKPAVAVLGDSPVDIATAEERIGVLQPAVPRIDLQARSPGPSGTAAGTERAILGAPQVHAGSQVGSASCSGSTVQNIPSHRRGSQLNSPPASA